MLEAMIDRFNLKLRLFSLSTATLGNSPIFDQPIRRIGQGEPLGSTVLQLKLRLFSLSTPSDRNDVRTEGLVSISS